MDEGDRLIVRSTARWVPVVVRCALRKPRSDIALELGHLGSKVKDGEECCRTSKESQEKMREA